MVRLLSIKMLVLSSVVSGRPSTSGIASLETHCLGLLQNTHLCSQVAAAEVCHLYSNTIESPCFTVVKEGSDYQIREYAGTQAEVK